MCERERAWQRVTVGEKECVCVVRARVEVNERGRRVKGRYRV